MSAPLTKPQKAILAQIIKATWEKLGRPGESESAWRHEEVKKACGARGLRDACNDDFNAIKAHFLNLQGETGQAMEAELRRQSEGMRRHRHNLVAAIGKAGLGPDYAVRLARDKFHCELGDCTEGQLLHLIITVRARAQKKEGIHRAGSAPKRRDKKKKADPLDPAQRLPALTSEDDRANAELSTLNSQLT